MVEKDFDTWPESVTVYVMDHLLPYYGSFWLLVWLYGLTTS